MLLQQEHDEQAIHLRSALREIEDLQGQVDSLQQGLSPFSQLIWVLRSLSVLLSDLKSGGGGGGKEGSDHGDRTKLKTVSHSKRY